MTSTPWQGSTFWLTVRFGKTTDAVAPAPTFTGKAVSRGLLEDAGFVVDLACGGLQSLALAGYAQIPILAMTSKAFDEDRQVCLDAGMNDHIAKPVDPSKLHETLRA